MIVLVYFTPLITIVGAHLGYIYIYIYTMTSIFEGQSPQNKAFSDQNRGHLGSIGVHYMFNQIPIALTI